ncbi:putative membrane protein [Francisella frigiditurris]|uniref:Putative membrane protein n=1 Tax=Francisella frigiditurris TaxID=1542390 RepID=A0A1J0KRM0_9GAMM|nr:putative membrane protein [Francisella frigiditurris]
MKRSIKYEDIYMVIVGIGIPCLIEGFFSYLGSNLF